MKMMNELKNVTGYGSNPFFGLKIFQVRLIFISLSFHDS